MEVVGPAENDLFSFANYLFFFLVANIVHQQRPDFELKAEKRGHLYVYDNNTYRNHKVIQPFIPPLPGSFEEMNPQRDSGRMRATGKLFLSGCTKKFSTPVYLAWH
jgi:hypothetical protein